MAKVARWKSKMKKTGRKILSEKTIPIAPIELLMQPKAPIRLDKDADIVAPTAGTRLPSICLAVLR